MSTELLPAITLLEGDYDEMVRNANALLGTINLLRARAGLPPKEPGGGSSPGGGSTPLTQIKPDTFYGKKLQTAMREYLEMRKAHGDGPAKPREIYDAITVGGFNFDAATPEIALVGMRAMLRKRTNFFHKLPNGTYGLTSWYEHLKAPKVAKGATADDADADDADDSADETDEADDAAA